MKFATSLGLLGELKSAEDCNYSSFKDLGLICPHCKQSVYLVDKHERSASNRVLKSGRTVPVRHATVNSHFVHHSLDTDLCELKDKSISPQTIIHRATVARNQRAAILRDRFWSIFCSGQQFKKIINCDNFQEFNKHLESTVKTGTFAIFLNSSSEKLVVNTTCGLDPIERVEGLPLIKNTYPLPSSLLESTINAIWLKFSSITDDIIPFHYNAIKEALLFLYSPTNKKLLRKCLVALVVTVYTTKLFEQCAFHLNSNFTTSRNTILDRASRDANFLISVDSEIQLEDKSKMVSISGLFVILVMSLALINWKSEFEKHSNLN